MNSSLFDVFQHWTIGKIVDKIAEAAKLRNDNNVNTVERVSAMNSIDYQCQVNYGTRQGLFIDWLFETEQTVGCACPNYFIPGYERDHQELDLHNQWKPCFEVLTICLSPLFCNINFVFGLLMLQPAAPYQLLQQKFPCYGTAHL